MKDKILEVLEKRDVDLQGIGLGIGIHDLRKDLASEIEAAIKEHLIEKSEVLKMLDEIGTNYGGGFDKDEFGNKTRYKNVLGELIDKFKSELKGDDNAKQN